MSSNTFYQPLDNSKSQIRLIRIIPDADHHPIRCELSIIDWELYPKHEYYDALSYEWGDVGYDREVNVQGKPFMVRENLWHALHHLRSAKFNCPIWIDAICINQDDPEERSAQVNKMDMIYGSAKSVHVWLGQEGQQSTAAFGLLEEISDFFKLILKEAAFETSVASREISIFTHIKKQVVLKETLDLYSFFSTISDYQKDGNVSDLWKTWYELFTKDDGWRAITNLLNRTYWSRIWIVQEYVLAHHKTLHCGRHIIDTRFIELALTFIQKLDPGKHAVNPGIQESILRIQSSPGALIVKSATPWLSLRRSLQELLAACKDSKASEPRDKIYGLIGLAMDIWEFDIKTDYRKPVSEIKFDVIRSYISLNWHRDRKKDAYKLWLALDNMLPETQISARREQERITLGIIDQELPTPPRVQCIQRVIKEFDTALQGGRVPPKDSAGSRSESQQGLDHIYAWVKSQGKPFGMGITSNWQKGQKGRSQMNHACAQAEPYKVLSTLPFTS
ncbi:heterokaryon incompatibility protein-domain-containing protein [Tricladium varicosporioides]|nr:heterokaryon incompatibility protein-domain-containing protein [Hymenoscyphus varicosporioides]